MFHLQKAFEKTLRSSSYERPPVAGSSTLKPEIHRGCTGKAHACGTLKNKKPEPPKPQRKNSVSSETISDSGSEGSSLNSANNDANKLAAAKAINGGRAPSERRSQTPARRRTSDTIISVDQVDKARTRLNSDGDEKLTLPSSPGERKNSGPFQRSASFRVPRVTQSPVRPPWNSNLGGKKETPPAKVEVSRPSLRLALQMRHRGSFRRRNDGINWLNLWESALGQRMDGGTFKHLDKLLESKVSCLSFVYLYVGFDKISDAHILSNMHYHVS